MLQLLKIERQERNVLYDSCVALVLPDNKTFFLCVGKARVTLMSYLAPLCSGLVLFSRQRYVQNIKDGSTNHWNQWEFFKLTSVGAGSNPILNEWLSHCQPNARINRLWCKASPGSLLKRCIYWGQQGISPHAKFSSWQSELGWVNIEMFSGIVQKQIRFAEDSWKQRFCVFHSCFPVELIRPLPNKAHLGGKERLQFIITSYRTKPSLIQTVQ